MIDFIYSLLGYQKKKPSLLLMHMSEFTHSSWLTDIQNQGRISRYLHYWFNSIHYLGTSQSIKQELWKFYLTSGTKVKGARSHLLFWREWIRVPPANKPWISVTWRSPCSSFRSSEARRSFILLSLWRLWPGTTSRKLRLRSLSPAAIMNVWKISTP